ncbi:hypothetical protein JHK85_044300 [Glycine max]|nr:hypothetical protein JHK86_043635 [Glycine max]KAG4957920.1 hypothetical protein JHK85_044300 [Glycine max]
MMMNKRQKVFPKWNIDFVTGKVCLKIETCLNENSTVGGEGWRWGLGLGNMVNIWQEPWLRKQGHRYVETPMVEGLEDMTVADIVSHQNDSWNLDIINQILIPDDIIDVTHTIVPSLMADDKLK